MVRVRLLGAWPAGYGDFSRLSFHVPALGLVSAAGIPLGTPRQSAATARMNRILRIDILSLFLKRGALGMQRNEKTRCGGAYAPRAAASRRTVRADLHSRTTRDWFGRNAVKSKKGFRVMV